MICNKGSIYLAKPFLPGASIQMLRLFNIIRKILINCLSEVAQGDVEIPKPMTMLHVTFVEKMREKMKEKKVRMQRSLRHPISITPSRHRV